MNAQLNIDIGVQQLFDLAKKLPSVEQRELFCLLEEEQYLNNIPAAHKKLVRQRINKSNENPARMIDEKSAIDLINAM
jgi:hypothetical protein